MAGTVRGTSIEVYEVESTKPGLRFTYKPDAIGVLASDGPMPEPGDIVLMPRSAATRSGEQALVGCDALTPYRVMEREHVYVRDRSGERAPGEAPPARYLTSWLFVRRVGEEEDAADVERRGRARATWRASGVISDS